MLTEQLCMQLDARIKKRMFGFRGWHALPGVSQIRMMREDHPSRKAYRIPAASCCIRKQHMSGHNRAASEVAHNSRSSATPNLSINHNIISPSFGSCPHNGVASGLSWSACGPHNHRLTCEGCLHQSGLHFSPMGDILSGFEKNRTLGEVSVSG
jgi:hypothetical protein